MIHVTNVDGTKTIMISRLVLEQLRMLMDWQLRQLGYSPESITAACLKVDQ